MKKQPKKNYQVIKNMSLNELAEHHTYFLENFWKLMQLNPDIKGLQCFIKEWLLEDVKDGN